MLHRESTGLVAYFIRAYPRRSLMMVFCLLIAGLTEGIGIAVLLPLLETSMSAGQGPQSAFGQYVEEVIRLIGLTPRLEVFLVILVAGISLKGLFSWLAMLEVGYTVSRVVADLRMKLIRALLEARWSYFIRYPTGRFANAIAIEATQAGGAYYEASIAMAYCIQLIVYTAVAVMISWKVALVAIATGFLIMFILKRLIQKGRKAGRSKTDLSKALVSRLTDALQGIKPIKAMAGEDHLLPLLEAETMGLNRAQRKKVAAQETLRASQEPITALFLASGLLVLVYLGKAPFSVILMLAFIFFRMVTRLNEAQYRYQKLVTVESAFWSLMDSIKRAESEAEADTDGHHAPTFNQAIHIEGVTFGYDEKPVLKEISMVIPKGAFIGICGPSGAGKTTIADLIIGLMHPQKGRISIDGSALCDINLTAWRKQVGYVPQEMFLFHDSIYRNIILGDTAIHRTEVESALRAAGAWEFVSALPQGMDTIIGEHGGRISGGERQRIAIATALVRRPKLLVLDEVTTALDPRTEAEICATLRSLSGDITIIAISHQPALMKEASEIYRLEDGRVTHQKGVA